MFRYLKPPAAAGDFATCHVTLFGWRNGGRAGTFRYYYGDASVQSRQSPVLSPCASLQNKKEDYLQSLPGELQQTGLLP